MKFSINLFIFYAVVYYFRSVESRSHGSDTHVSNQAENKGYVKYKPEKTESFDMSTKLYGANTFKRPLKQNMKQIKTHSKSSNFKNRNAVAQTIYHTDIVINEPKPKIMSMDEGHKIKISSILRSKHLAIKSKGRVKEISFNPKFSHIIEMLQRNESYKINEKELAPTKVPEVPKETIDEFFAQPLDLDTNVSGLLGDETSTEPCLENLNIASKETFTDLEKEKNEFHNEENIKIPTEQISEIPESVDLQLNLDEISENVISSETTLFESRSGEDEQVIFNDEFEGSGEEFSFDDADEISENVISRETAVLGSRSGEDEQLIFNDEFEGSGEEFSFDDASLEDQNASKDGRLLSLISQRNNNSSACTTPKGESGQCRRIRECLLSDALNNFNVFLRQLCLIRGVLVGVCCPDNPVIEITNTEETTESNVDDNVIEQPPEGCGLNTNTRIVGGTISAPHEWTWMVALLRRNRFYCGGVIINNWYILTAAHCVLGMNVKDLTVRLGEYDFNADSKHKEDISVAEIKRHAQFVTLTFQHDIALLKLQRSIRYSKFVGSICLPTQKARDYSDVQGTVVGWGTVSFGGAASTILRQVTVPVWKNVDCDRTYFLEKISDAFLCAGSPEKGEDACQGDSGGPLMTLSEGGRWEVIGIVSWGRRCGDPTYPGVYTRVTTYLDWILQNID